MLAVPFFDTHLPRKLVEVEDAEVVNRLFPATKVNLQLGPDALFDSQIGTGIDQEALVQRLTEKVAHIQDPEERFKIALEDLKSRANEPLPEIERFPVHYAEEGIEGFKLVLRLRQVVAMQHWLGNPGSPWAMRSSHSPIRFERWGRHPTRAVLRERAEHDNSHPRLNDGGATRPGHRVGGVRWRPAVGKEVGQLLLGMARQTGRKHPSLSIFSFSHRNILSELDLAPQLGDVTRDFLSEGERADSFSSGR